MSVRDIREGWFNYMQSTVDRIFKRNGFPDDFKESVKERIAICKSCPELKLHKTRILGSRCNQCGCAFPAMAYAKKKKCPIGSWGAID